MRKVRLLFFLYTLTTLVQAQSKIARVYIAPFRHDAEGAYTLIHDDFGAAYANGIENYIDTMCHNRKLPICFAAITGECDKEDWEKAKAMIAHGHQILNHSMNHKCGQPQSWCTFGDWNEKDFPTEIDKSTELILKNTGKHPAFFVFPFDLFTDTMLAYLQHTKFYIGARAGKQNVLNSADMKGYDDLFHINYTVLQPGQSLSALKEMVDKAIQEKSWGVRVLHGVEDDSWAHIKAEEYAAHLNYLQQQVQQNKLWVATLSDVVNYQSLKKALSKVYINKKHANGQVAQLAFEYPLSVSRARQQMEDKTISIVLIQTGIVPKYIIQDDKTLAFKIDGNKIVFDADPYLGDIDLTY